MLRESYRQDGKVRKRTLANLSVLSAPVIKGLNVLLRGGVAVNSAEEAFVVERSLPHSHFAVGSCLGLEQCRADDHLPLHSFNTLLKDLATLNYSVTYTRLNPEAKIVLTTRPTPPQEKTFRLLAIDSACTQ